MNNAHTHRAENDTQALAQGAEAERKVVEAAFRAYQSRLFHAALRITRNEDDARDAVQDGMVSVMRNAGSFRGDAALASWMYSIVVNAALYQRRRALARRRGVERYEEKVGTDTWSSLEAVTEQRDPETYVLSRVELGRTLGRIAELPRDKRSLVERSIEGDSCAEIAQHSGKPVAAIKSKLWRTRSALRVAA